jgi:hypothetical protein
MMFTLDFSFYAGCELVLAAADAAVVVAGLGAMRLRRCVDYRALIGFRAGYCVCAATADCDGSCYKRGSEN